LRKHASVASEFYVQVQTFSPESGNDNETRLRWDLFASNNGNGLTGKLGTWDLGTYDALNMY